MTHPTSQDLRAVPRGCDPSPDQDALEEPGKGEVGKTNWQYQLGPYAAPHPWCTLLPPPLFPPPFPPPPLPHLCPSSSTLLYMRTTHFLGWGIPTSTHDTTRKTSGGCTRHHHGCIRHRDDHPRLCPHYHRCHCARPPSAVLAHTRVQRSRLPPTLPRPSFVSPPPLLPQSLRLPPPPSRPIPSSSGCFRRRRRRRVPPTSLSPFGHSGAVAHTALRRVRPWQVLHTPPWV